MTRWIPFQFHYFFVVKYSHRVSPATTLNSFRFQCLTRRRHVADAA